MINRSTYLEYLQLLFAVDSAYNDHSLTTSSFFCIITVHNSSCGKVMFSQVCVIPSVRGGGMCAAGGMHAKEGGCA